MKSEVYKCTDRYMELMSRLRSKVGLLIALTILSDIPMRGVWCARMGTGLGHKMDTTMSQERMTPSLIVPRRHKV